ARLALVEALRVERVGEAQVTVVQVVAELVEQRAEVGPEGDDPPLSRGAHPELDAGRPAPSVLRVEALELAPLAVRPRRQHLDPARPDLERPRERGEERLRGLLDGQAILGPERGL